MKLRFNNNAGMTLIEVIIALAFLLIMAVGFTKLFTFTGTTVNHAERDTSSNASARSTANTLLATPVNPIAGEPVDISIVWGRGDTDTEQDISVIRDIVGVESATGSDSEIKIYRKPVPDPSETADPPLFELITTIRIQFNYGGNLYKYETIAYHEGGVPYAEIVTPLRAEVIRARNGSMPDYWLISGKEEAIAYGGVDSKGNVEDWEIYTEMFGRIWDWENENVYEDSSIYPMWY